MDKIQEQSEDPFEVFELMEPQDLKRMLVDLFMLHLKGDKEACTELWHEEAVQLLDRIYKYLDDPIEKHHNEILRVVSAHQFLRVLIRLMLSYLDSVRGYLPEEFKDMFGDLHAVMAYLLYLYE